MPDLQQQLQQLVSNDLPLLDFLLHRGLFREGTWGACGHYYPDSDLVDTEARFLKKSQIPKFSKNPAWTSFKLTLTAMILGLR